MGAIVREQGHNDKPHCGIYFAIDAVRRHGMTRAFWGNKRGSCAADTRRTR